MIQPTPVRRLALEGLRGIGAAALKIEMSNAARPRAAPSCLSLSTRLTESIQSLKPHHTREIHNLKLYTTESHAAGLRAGPPATTATTIVGPPHLCPATYV